MNLTIYIRLNVKKSAMTETKNTKIDLKIFLHHNIDYLFHFF